MLYEYIETSSKEDIPVGEGWEYWGKKITPENKRAVWRREEGKYNPEDLDMEE